MLLLLLSRLFLFLLFISLIESFLMGTGAHGQPKKMPKQEIPSGLDLVYYDNGLGSLWYEPVKKSDSKGDYLLVCFLDQGESFSTNQKNIRVLESLYPYHVIIYLENPGLGFSYEVMAFSDEERVQELKIAYECILRYKSWTKIIWTGYGWGAKAQSILYPLCRQDQIKMPEFILHLNGAPTNATSNGREEYDSLSCPLFIIHSRHNKIYSFMDSVLLHQKLRPHSTLLLLYGQHNTCLLSKENKELLEKTILELNSKQPKEVIFFK